MEVHHHPDIHHKRKKFKEYFLEFVMICRAAEHQKQLAERLIQLIKQEYHWDNE